MASAAPQPDPVAGLIDIPLPAPVSLWPQTWESRLAIALLAAGLVAAVWWYIGWRRANRHRRAALAELDRIAQSPPARPRETASALALLVRRTALAVFPREEVAALSGTAWLAFLDRSYGGHEFSQGVGRALCTAPYDDRETPMDLGPLINLVRRWIKTYVP